MDGNIIFKFSIVLLTMPLTRFLFAAHFCKKRAKKFRREYFKNYTSKKADFFAKDGEGKSLQKTKIKKNCKIVNVSFLQHTVVFKLRVILFGVKAAWYFYYGKCSQAVWVLPNFE